MARLVRGFAVVWLTAAIGGCREAPPPRPQLVVVVDTDAPTTLQAADPLISEAAAIDTLRIDVLGTAGTPSDIRSISVADPEAWPVTFGVADPVEAGQPVRLRLRLFARRFAAQSEVGGLATLEPPPGVTIDRVVEIATPAEGISHMRILLASDCRGTPSSYLEPPTTCIDGERLEGAPTDGVELTDAGAAHTSQVGTWPGARQLPCAGEEQPGRQCVWGGFRTLGDNELSQETDIDRLASTPLHPVLITPFWMDETELTVARLRVLLEEGFLPIGLWEHDPNDPERAHCTWTTDAGDHENHPLNCVTWQFATNACTFVGGTLPSEAQWEHAAQGCGRRKRFPWGSEPPTCCIVSASRHGTAALAACDGEGLEAVMSHEPTVLCANLGDLTCEGIHDMAGGVSEAVVDHFRPYNAGCWQREGIAHDPVCVDPAAAGHVARGGSWAARLSETAAAFRWLFRDRSPAHGFRCVYPDD